MRKQMNQIEIHALHWISKTTGYKEDDISFVKDRSPDFITPDGKGFEVKRLSRYGKRITIYSRQWQSLYQHPNCVILIFAGLDEPLATIPLKEIPPNTKTWHDFKITSTETNPNSIPFTLYTQNLARRVAARNRALLQYRTNHPDLPLKEIAQVFHLSGTRVAQILKQGDEHGRRNSPS